MQSNQHTEFVDPAFFGGVGGGFRYSVTCVAYLNEGTSATFAGLANQIA